MTLAAPGVDRVVSAAASAGPASRNARRRPVPLLIPDGTLAGVVATRSGPGDREDAPSPRLPSESATAGLDGSAIGEEIEAWRLSDAAPPGEDPSGPGPGAVAAVGPWSSRPARVVADEDPGESAVALGPPGAAVVESDDVVQPGAVVSRGAAGAAVRPSAGWFRAAEARPGVGMHADPVAGDVALMPPSGERTWPEWTSRVGGDPADVLRSGSPGQVLLSEGSPSLAAATPIRPGAGTLHGVSPVGGGVVPGGGSARISADGAPEPGGSRPASPSPGELADRISGAGGSPDIHRSIPGGARPSSNAALLGVPTVRADDFDSASGVVSAVGGGKKPDGTNYLDTSSQLARSAAAAMGVVSPPRGGGGGDGGWVGAASRAIAAYATASRRLREATSDKQRKAAEAEQAAAVDAMVKVGVHRKDPRSSESKVAHQVGRVLARLTEKAEAKAGTRKATDRRTRRDAQDRRHRTGEEGRRRQRRQASSQSLSRSQRPRPTPSPKRLQAPLTPTQYAEVQRKAAIRAAMNAAHASVAAAQAKLASVTRSYTKSDGSTGSESSSTAQLDHSAAHNRNEAEKARRNGDLATAALLEKSARADANAAHAARAEATKDAKAALRECEKALKKAGKKISSEARAKAQAAIDKARDSIESAEGSNQKARGKEHHGTNDQKQETSKQSEKDTKKAVSDAAAAVTETAAALESRPADAKSSPKQQEDAPDGRAPAPDAESDPEQTPEAPDDCAGKPGPCHPGACDPGYTCVKCWWVQEGGWGKSKEPGAPQFPDRYGELRPPTGGPLRHLLLKVALDGGVAPGAGAADDNCKKLIDAIMADHLKAMAECRAKAGVALGLMSAAFGAQRVGAQTGRSQIGGALVRLGARADSRVAMDTAAGVDPSDAIRMLAPAALAAVDCAVKATNRRNVLLSALDPKCPESLLMELLNDSDSTFWGAIGGGGVGTPERSARMLSDWMRRDLVPLAAAVLREALHELIPIVNRRLGERLDPREVRSKIDSIIIDFETSVNGALEQHGTRLTSAAQTLERFLTDLSESHSEVPVSLKILNDIGVGIVPGLGQIVDVLDTAAAARDLGRDPGWWEAAGLLLALAAWIPAVGDLLGSAGKRAIKLLKPAKPTRLGKAIGRAGEILNTDLKDLFRRAERAEADAAAGSLRSGRAVDRGVDADAAAGSAAAPDASDRYAPPPPPDPPRTPDPEPGQPPPPSGGKQPAPPTKTPDSGPPAGGRTPDGVPPSDRVANREARRRKAQQIKKRRDKRAPARRLIDRKRRRLTQGTHEMPDGSRVTIDANGRTTRVEVDGIRTDRPARRRKHLEAQVGQAGGVDFEGGHLFGRQFGGASEVQNLVPLHADANRRMRVIEQEMAASVRAGRQVRNLRVELDWSGGPDVPVAVKMRVEIQQPDGTFRPRLELIENGPRSP